MYYVIDHVGFYFNNLFLAHIPYSNPWREFIFSNFNISNGVVYKIPEGPIEIVTGKKNKNLIFYDYTFIPYLGFRLISNKLVILLNKYNIPKLDFYSVEIKYRGLKKIVDGYYLMNFYNYIPSLDLQGSIYNITPKNKLNNFQRLVLDESLIQTDTKMFIPLNTNVYVTHKEIMDDCKKQKVTGIKFIPINEFKQL